MNKNIKFNLRLVLLTVAVVLTLGAAGVWGYVYVKANPVNTVNTEVSATLTKRSADSKRLPQNFAVVFAQGTVSASATDIAEVGINFAGDLSTIKEVTLAFSYDPKAFTVENFVNGQVFGEVSKLEVNDEAGVAMVTLTELANDALTSGELGSIQFTLKQDKGVLSIMENDLVVTDFSKVVNKDGVTLSLGGSSLEVLKATE